MKEFTIVIGKAMITVAGIFFLAILGTLFGALSGLVVGWFLGGTILDVLSKCGLHGVAMWQVGATAGWLGAFLKTKVDATVKASD